MSENKKLFLLDAMALIFRAHFAFSKNPLVNSKGISTGAILGFTNSLLEVLNKEKPSHIAVAFDTSEPTFRHEEYEEYKANREEQPEDIQVAIPYVKKLVEAFNIPILIKDGYEADDIIGTIAKEASRQGYEVYMMTPDKDFMQLVEDHLYLYKPAYMGNSVEIFDVDKVLKKFDVDKIDQVRDILGLQGDNVDNIPGIPGFGPKTASKLVKQYGSVENLVEHAHELKGKQKERLEEYGEQGVMSKRLATIQTDVPIEYNLDEFKVGDPDWESLRSLFDELEFRNLKKKFFGNGQSGSGNGNQSGQTDLFEQFGSQPADTGVKEEEELSGPDTIYNVPHEYHLMNTRSLREQLLEYLKIQESFCFDTETTSLEPFNAEIVGLSFAYYPGEAFYVPLPRDQEEAKQVVEEFREVFEDASIGKTGQNLKYDLVVMGNYGIEVQGPLFDTMLAHYLLEPEKRHGMDLMAEEYLNYNPVSIETLIGKKGVNQGNMKDLPPEDLVEYACEDADITLQLRNVLEPKLEGTSLRKVFDEIETPLLPVLTEMERAGVRVDADDLRELSNELAEDMQALERKIYDMAGEEFNIGSPKQLGEVLFEKLQLEEKAKRTKSGQYATGEEVLIKMTNDHPIIQAILDWRELQKLKTTYVDTLPDLISPKDGKIHTSYNQAVAATGRLSSTNPNLQNIPIRTERGREIRKAFKASDEDYVLLSADYSQIELRIMASFSKDESMIEAFRNGEDIHTTTAMKVFKVNKDEVTREQRSQAKVVNFGIIYGISAYGLSERMGISRREASSIITAYFDEFPAVKEFMDRCIEEGRKKEYTETLFGRRRYLREINSRNATMRGYAERNAINAPIQGTAADMIKIAMVNIHDWLVKNQLNSRMIMQVHDELIFDVKRDEEQQLREAVHNFMYNAVELEVPMEVEMGSGNDWLEAH